LLILRLKENLVSILVVGDHLAQATYVREAVERTAHTAHFLSGIAQVQEWLNTAAPSCVLAFGGAELSALNRELRFRAECFGVPLIAVTDRPTERAYLELRLSGADDIIAAHDVGGLTRRLSALKTFDHGARTALFQGVCLVAHPDPYQRQLVGRVLRQAGFEVSFAADTHDALEMAGRAPPKVLIVSDRIEPAGGAAALKQLAAHWVGDMPAVLLSTQEGKSDGSAFSCVSESAPPDDLLFVVNELLRPRELVESRASRRLLLASLCMFRAAGEFEARSGLTYNISREGLYVRTFDAPATRGKVWVELRPPGEESVCHLRGDVVWIRALTTGAHGAAPPGFGVRLTLEDSPPDDRIRYVQAYERLLAAQS
jgi:DNA-binding response OmpR family regulator